MDETIARLRENRSLDKKSSNRMFIILALICCVYFVWVSGWVIAVATLLLIYIIFTRFEREKKRKKIFAAHQNDFYQQLEAFLKQKICITGTEKIACGYIEMNDEFLPVFVCLSEQDLKLYPFIYENSFVYSENNDFWYLYSMKQETGEIILSEKANELVWNCSCQGHQTFLREKAVKWNDLMIMEYYIYGRILERKSDGKISMDEGIDSLRKENIYSAALRDGRIIYLNDSAMKELCVMSVKNVFGDGKEC